MTTHLNPDDWRDFDVEVTVKIKMPVNVHNPDFTAADALGTAMCEIEDALQRYTTAYSVVEIEHEVTQG